MSANRQFGYESPLGTLRIVTTDDAIVGIYFPNHGWSANRLSRQTRIAAASPSTRLPSSAPADVVASGSVASDSVVSDAIVSDSVDATADRPLVMQQLTRWLDCYFAGQFLDVESESESVSLALVGTEFQNRVWAALRQIPLGATTTYGQLAQQIGTPQAVRAVGAAVGRNPVSIVVPCHRVVGAGGKLTGFAGGLDRKRWLLTHESISVKPGESTVEFPGTASVESPGLRNEKTR